MAVLGSTSLTGVSSIIGNSLELVLSAGESSSYTTGQTNELVYINAESGLEINSSPDNWVSGWAGRKTATICGPTGDSTFPGNVTARFLAAPGGGPGGVDTATTPSFTWSGDLDTGMYRAGTDSIGFTVGGVNRVTIDGNTISFVDTQSNYDSSIISHVIDYNLTGATALTANRTQRGIYLDLDHTATGGTSTDGTRESLIGIQSDIDTSGTPYAVYGMLGEARSNNTTGTITSIIGVRGLAEGDSGTGGTTSNVYGIQGDARDGGTGTVSNVYGGQFFVLKETSATATLSIATAMRAEVEIDGNTITTTKAGEFIIDIDGGTLTNAYLTYGVYEGTIQAGCWNLYYPSDAPSFINGELRLGANTDLGSEKLQVTGNVRATESISGNTLISTVAIGTAPLTVTSTTLVTNLNADLLDGEHLLDSDDTGNTVVGRDATGDIHARLIRQTYTNQTTISGGMVFRVNNTTDNFLRVCNDVAAIRTFLNVLPLTGGTLSGALLAAAGSISAPGIAGSADTNTGIWWEGSDKITVVAGGARAAYFNTTEQLNYGNIYVTTADDAAADGTTTTRASNGYYLRGKYWNGTASVNLDWNSISVPTDTAGNSEWRIRTGATNRLTISNTGIVTATTFAGNATTATRLTADRTINGVIFNGTGSINVPDLRADNGTVLVDGTGVTSAVNYVSLTNAAAAGTVTLSTAGSDTNIPLQLTTKGTGSLTIATAGGNIALRPTAGSILFYDATNTYYTNLDNGSLTANRSLVMPNANVTLVGGTMVPTTGTGATGSWGISVTGSSASCTGNAATATNCSRSVLAGNGITGGGALSADRTITLGTPGSLTGSTTNAVTTTSHTHDLTVNLGVTGGTTAGPVITSSAGTSATIPSASASASGAVTTGAQTFAGEKTFSSVLRSGTSATVANTINTTGIVESNGYRGRAGNGGAVGNTFNIEWTGTLSRLWIDTTMQGAFSYASDYRIKKDVTNMLGGAISRVVQLRPVSFKRKAYGELFTDDPTDSTYEGFIAHELAKVIPSGVDGEKDAPNQIQSLRLDAIVAVLTKALQEQQEIINSLNQRLSLLEN